MSDKPKRKSKMFWVLGESDVRYLKCYECNESGEMWWCPQAGFTGSTLHHFFTDRQTALEKLVVQLSQDKEEIDTLLNKAIKNLNSL